MADYQRIIDEIRFLLDSGDCDLTDELRRLASDYAQMCKETNARLRRCEDFLKKGLRSEAIHLAEAEPKLLDNMALVDFAEREQWCEIVSIYQLERPEPVLLSVAESLNAAYTVQEPLQNLLARHRVLALARAPLVQRLDVLWQLATLDPDGVWEDDVRALEQARLREIDAQSAAAANSGDTATLKRLMVEVTHPNWRSAPPESLVKSVKSRGSQVIRIQARQDLERLDGELNAAFGALDLTRARNLRTEWNEQLRLAHLAANDPLLEQVAPVLEWVGDEDTKGAVELKYQQSVAALERALDESQSSRPELEALGQAVVNCGRGLPEVLRNRFQHRLSALEINETRQHRLKIGSAVAALLLVIGIFGWVASVSSKAQAVKRVALAAEDMIDQHQLPQARALLEQHADTMSTTEPWLAAQRKLSDVEQQETRRAAEFQQALETARKSSDHDQARPAVQQARELARTIDDKAQVARVEEHWESSRRKQASARDERFRKQLETAAKALERLNGLLKEADPGTDADAAVERADQEVRELRESESTASGELSGQVPLLVSRLESLRKLRADQQQRTQLMDDITRSALILPKDVDPLRKVGVYAEALQAYAKAFPEEAWTKELPAPEEIELWRSVLKSQVLVETWKGSFHPRDADDVRQRLDAFETLLSMGAKCPEAAAGHDYVKYLESLRRRDAADDAGESIKHRLKELFSGSLLEDLHVLKLKDGNVYYLTSAQDFSSKLVVGFQYVAGFDGETRSKTVNSDQLQIAFTKPAPQNRMAETVHRELPELAFDGWDAFMRRLSTDILDSIELDPLLKYVLLLRVLEYAGEGDLFLQEELKPILALLDNEKIDLAARWMDPQDASARKSKDNALAVLKRIKALPDPKNLAGAWNRAKARSQKLQESLTRPVSCVGWLTRDSSRKWICRSNWKPTDDCVLQVLLPGSGEAPAIWKPIGAVEKKALKLAVLDAGTGREGRLVFAVRKSAPRVLTSSSGN